MTREEAIEIVKKLYNDSLFLKKDKEAMLTLVPELKEGEDERIRTELLSSFKGIMADADEDELWYGLPYNDIIAWLEKQKEKPLTIESAYEKFVNSETLKEAKENKYIRAQLLWELMHNGIITEADYQYLTDDKRKPWTAEEYSIAYQKGFDTSEQLKQEEQKPAEWSKEDKEQIAQIERIVKEEGYSKTIQEKIHNWFDSLRPQPKQEWSKEDKEWLSKVYYAIDNSRYSDDEKRGMKKYIKSLRPQPKQEWSEEEERKLQKCIKIVERWEEDYDIAYAPYSGMLKSLRP